ncbi:hypothetical protein D3C86_2193740 [compost metagenome]
MRGVEQRCLVCRTQRIIQITAALLASVEGEELLGAYVVAALDRHQGDLFGLVLRG